MAPNAEGPPCIAATVYVYRIDGSDGWSLQGARFAYVKTVTCWPRASQLRRLRIQRIWYSLRDYPQIDDDWQGILNYGSFTFVEPAAVDILSNITKTLGIQGRGTEGYATVAKGYFEQRLSTIIIPCTELIRHFYGMFPSLVSDLASGKILGSDETSYTPR